MAQFDPQAATNAYLARYPDVAAAGLAEPIYAMGVTVGDYDADGDADFYVTALGPDRLYRNDAGRFTNVAGALGLDDPGFGSSATWLDYDRDGDLDLFSLNYVQGGALVTAGYRQ